MSLQPDNSLSELQNVSMQSHSIVRRDTKSRPLNNPLENIENIPPPQGSLMGSDETGKLVVLRDSRQASPTRILSANSPRHSSGHTLTSSNILSSPSLVPKQRLNGGARELDQEAMSSNVEFATALGDRMVAEVRKLQTDLIDKEDQIRCMTIKNQDGNITNLELEMKLRNAIASEEKLKATMWELETHEQEMGETMDGLVTNKLRLEAEIVKLKHIASEKTDQVEALHFENQSLSTALVDLKTTHSHNLNESKLIQEDLRKEIESYQLQLQTAEWKLIHEKEMHSSSKDFENLTYSLPEYVGDSDDCDSLSSSVPASPIKSTPLKNSTLESETMKGTLYNHQNKMLRQRKELEREKKLRLQLQHQLKASNDALQNLEKQHGQNENRRPPRSRQGNPSQRHSKSGHGSDIGVSYHAIPDTAGDWEAIDDTFQAIDGEGTNTAESYKDDECLLVAAHVMGASRESNEKSTIIPSLALEMENSLNPDIGNSFSAPSGTHSNRSSQCSDNACKPLHDELECLAADELEPSASHDYDLYYAPRREVGQITSDHERSRSISTTQPSSSPLPLADDLDQSCLYRSIATQTEQCCGAEEHSLAVLPTQAEDRASDDHSPSLLASQSVLGISSPAGSLTRTDAAEIKESSYVAVNDKSKLEKPPQSLSASKDQLIIQAARLEELLSNEVELLASRLAIEQLTKEKMISVTETAKSPHTLSAVPAHSLIAEESTEVGENPPLQKLESCSASVPQPSIGNRQVHLGNGPALDSKNAGSAVSEMVAPTAPSNAPGTLRGRVSDKQISPFLSRGTSIQNQKRENQHSYLSVTSINQRSMSSISSFASEIEQCFNAHDNVLETDLAQNGNDPSTIEAITRTMIGMNMYKYTRRAGRQNLSTKRHKRYFWIHPYTKTLYWSIYNPVNAPEGAIIKSAPVIAIHTQDDFNPMPPGLHQQSIQIETPKRIIKITALRSVEHEDWVRSLNFLVSNSDGRSASLKSPKRCAHRASQTAGNELSFGSTRTVQSDKLSHAESHNDVRTQAGFVPTTFSRKGVSNLTMRSKLSLDDVADGIDMENVRTCCNGQHNVANLCNRSTRSRSSSRVRGSCP